VAEKKTAKWQHQYSDGNIKQRVTVSKYK